MKLKIKKCIVCGAKFTPYTNSQKYCSSKCRERSRTCVKKKNKSVGNLSNYTAYCREHGCIPYAEYQTKVLRKCGV